MKSWLGIDESLSQVEWWDRIEGREIEPRDRLNLTGQVLSTNGTVTIRYPNWKQTDRQNSLAPTSQIWKGI